MQPVPRAASAMLLRLRPAGQKSVFGRSGQESGFGAAGPANPADPPPPFRQDAGA